MKGETNGTVIMLGKRWWGHIAQQKHVGCGRCKRFAEKSSQDFALRGVLNIP